MFAVVSALAMLVSAVVVGFLWLDWQVEPKTNSLIAESVVRLRTVFRGTPQGGAL